MIMALDPKGQRSRTPG